MHEPLCPFFLLKHIKLEGISGPNVFDLELFKKNLLELIKNFNFLIFCVKECTGKKKKFMKKF